MKVNGSNNQKSVSKIILIGFILVLLLIALMAGFTKCNSTSSSSGAGYVNTEVTSAPKVKTCKVNLHLGDSSETIYVNRGGTVNLENTPSSESGYFAGWSEEEKDVYSRDDIDYPAAAPFVVSGAEVDLYPVFLNEYTIVNQSSDVVELRILINPSSPDWGASDEYHCRYYYIYPGQSYSFVPEFTLMMNGFYFYVGEHGGPYTPNLSDGSFSPLTLGGYGLNTSMVDGVIIIPEDYLIDPYGLNS